MDTQKVISRFVPPAHYETGWFYRIQIPIDILGIMFGRIDEPFKTHGIVRIGDLKKGSMVYTDDYGKIDDICECPVDPTHVTRYHLRELTVELCGGTGGNGLIPSSQYLVVAPNIAEQFSQSGLNADFRPHKVELNQSQWPLTEVHVLWPKPYSVMVPIRKFVPKSNICPYCGWGPVVCPHCFRIEHACERCGKSIVQAASKLTGKDDPRFIIAPHPPTWPMVDASKWNGEDFFKGRERFVFATKRSLDWLDRVHACPYMAAPVPTFTDGIDDAKRSMLEASTKPVGS